MLFIFLCRDLPRCINFEQVFFRKPVIIWVVNWLEHYVLFWLLISSEGHTTFRIHTTSSINPVVFAVGSGALIGNSGAKSSFLFLVDDGCAEVLIHPLLTLILLQNLLLLISTRSISVALQSKLRRIQHQLHTWMTIVAGQTATDWSFVRVHRCRCRVYTVKVVAASCRQGARMELRLCRGLVFKCVVH